MSIIVMVAAECYPASCLNTGVKLVSMKEKDIDKIKIILGLIIIVAIVGAVLGLSDSIISFLTQLGVSAIIGVITSAIVGALVEAITGAMLKRIALNIEIKGKNYSITAFAIATILLKLFLLR